jgi:hypothetical protein
MRLKSYLPSDSSGPSVDGRALRPAAMLLFIFMMIVSFSGDGLAMIS